MKKTFIPVVLSFLTVYALFVLAGCNKESEKKISVLLIDGQNNHAWMETTPVLVGILEGSGKFSVTVSTSPPAPPKAPRAPKEKTEEAQQKFAEQLKAWQAESDRLKAETQEDWAAWRPAFSEYDVVVSNYNGEPWPDEVKAAFEAYVKGGGGFVSVHAANNSFPEWKAYNEMIAVGGWGGRSELSGPYLRLREGNWTQDKTEGKGGSHGQRHEFVVETQAPDHPIMKGLPGKWKHAEDELYDRLRGPAENVTILGAAFSDTGTGGSGESEPMLMTISFGEGRVFHTTLGHNIVSMTGVGFQETLKRGTEWAATGAVTFPDVSADVLTLDTAAVKEVKLEAEPVAEPQAVY